MNTPHRLTPDDPRFPSRLADLDPPVAEVTVQGQLGPGWVVAIVGTREPTPEAETFAHDLAALCALHGVIVASGGALGIDAAAHRGALSVGGCTWAVLPTGCDHVAPEEHAPLYERIAAENGTLIWPFPCTTVAHPSTYFPRNRALVALSDAVVVVQAGIPSGALNAAKHARTLERPLWVVSPPAWDMRYAGSLDLLERGARPLTRGKQLLASLGLVPRGRSGQSDIQPREPTRPTRRRRRTKEEGQAALLFNATGSSHASTDQKAPTSPHKSFVPTAEAQALFRVAESMPLHIDELINRTQLPAAAVSTALLTLALENVLVEGPSGSFRRADAYKHLSSLNFLPKDAENDGEDARSRRVARQGEDDQEVSGGYLRGRRIEGPR
ncbi:DNA-protecting protein DprA [Pendulispora brunnea]|uniref:DNA-protecting protein DprA n=1 Tax=Pendulispora brunnea TaxID=2905690 RepID=A0ABZ2JWJ9_9BACT